MALAVGLLFCAGASAQIGIPLGATELAVPGLGPAPLPGAGCSTDVGGGPVTTTFDGGGMAGPPSAACAASDGLPALSDLAPPRLAGSIGIPLGATEIANPGLSPLPVSSFVLLPPLLPPIAAAPPPMAPPTVAAPCPVTGVFVDAVTRRSAAITSSSASAGAAGC
jgi:hypothetical protein